MLRIRQFLSRSLFVVALSAVVARPPALAKETSKDKEVVPTIAFAEVGQKQAEADSIRLIGHTACADVVEPSCDLTGELPCAAPEAPLCGPAEAPLCGEECASWDGGGDAACSTGCSCRRCCDRWYVSVSGAWQQRETVHEVGDPLTFIEFHSGFAANAALGLRLDTFRFEIETSFMNNEVDIAGAGGASSPSPGNVNLRAYMFNVYHDIEFASTRWKPYVGAGIGTYQSELNSLIPEFFGQVPELANTPVNSTSDMPLAYQFRAGVTRPFGCRSEFFTGYRYFRGEELEFASEPFAQFAPTFHPDGAEIHAIEFGVRVNF
jgi:opacity protein-like surface antigen